MYESSAADEAEKPSKLFRLIFFLASLGGLALSHNLFPAPESYALFAVSICLLCLSKIDLLIFLTSLYGLALYSEMANDIYTWSYATSAPLILLLCLVLISAIKLVLASKKVFGFLLFLAVIFSWQKQDGATSLSQGYDTVTCANCSGGGTIYDPGLFIEIYQTWNPPPAYVECWVCDGRGEVVIGELTHAQLIQLNEASGKN